MERSLETVSTATLTVEALASEGEAYAERVMALHARPTRETFELAAALCRSAESVERELGAAILGQLGVSQRPFVDESVEVVLELLTGETENDVLIAAAYAFAYLARYVSWDGANRVLSELLRLSQDGDAAVRTSTAFAFDALVSLGIVVFGRSATRALVTLANDPDLNVRDWAVFLLKNVTEQPDFITPELIATLRTNAEHAATPIRHQAIAALVYAAAPGSTALLLRELGRAAGGEEYWIDIVEAAKRLGEPALLPHLLQIRNSGHAEPWHLPSIEAAIAACSR